MQFKNTKNHFGLIAIFLHWLMALLIIGMLILGLYMTGLPISELKLRLYGIHKEFGVLILMLVVVRICWRIINITPSLSELPWFERFAARAAHYAFYFFMIAMPVSGWLMTSAAGLAPSFLGLFTLPNLVSADHQQMILFQEIHKWMAYALIATLCAHVAAALKHEFINRDTILRRMLP